MLAGRYRFHGHGSLKFLYHKGSTHRSRFVALRVAVNSRRADSRVAIIVTKKVQKAAPRRNRIRRRVYEIVRTNWNHLRPGCDMLITVYDPQAGVMPYEDLEAAVVHILKQAGMWQEGSSDGKAGV